MKKIVVLSLSLSLGYLSSAQGMGLALFKHREAQKRSKSLVKQARAFLKQENIDYSPKKKKRKRKENNNCLSKRRKKVTFRDEVQPEKGIETIIQGTTTPSPTKKELEARQNHWKQIQQTEKDADLLFDFTTHF